MSKREEITEAVKGALDDALLCSRVWEAWSYNTMTEDDFSQASDDDDFVAQIVDAVIAILSLAPVEPEWEYAIEHSGRYITRPTLSEIHRQAECFPWKTPILKRTIAEAGPWLPVEPAQVDPQTKGKADV